MPALRDQNAFPGFGEVMQLFATPIVIDDGAKRDRDFKILTALAVLAAALTMASTLCAEGVIVSELQQGVFLGVGDQVDAAAIAAITAAGPAPGDELLAPKRNATVTAAAGLDCNFGLIDEHF